MAKSTTFNPEEYPKEIYVIKGWGSMSVMIHSYHLITSDFKVKDRVPYIEYGMTPPPNEFGWRLEPWEFDVKYSKGLVGYRAMTLTEIERYLNGKAKFQGDIIWTTDREEAERISKERWEKRFPAGAHFDVALYSQGVINTEPMTYSEAMKLKRKKEETFRDLSPYYVKLHEN